MQYKEKWHMGKRLKLPSKQDCIYEYRKNNIVSAFKKEENEMRTHKNMLV